jgi:hypothetical protein
VQPNAGVVILITLALKQDVIKLWPGSAGGKAGWFRLIQ